MLMIYAYAYAYFYAYAYAYACVASEDRVFILLQSLDMDKNGSFFSRECGLLRFRLSLTVNYVINFDSKLVVFLETIENHYTSDYPPFS